MSYLILTDDEIGQCLTMADAMAAVEAALRAHACGTLVAPPRFSMGTERGALVFTAGLMPEFNIMGFRVYNTVYPGYSDPTQITAVYHSESGELLALIIGSRIGEMRTGALGGVAVDRLARPNATTLGVLGTGAQARTQVEAALPTRPFQSIAVYSRSEEKRAAFADELRRHSGLAVCAADSAEQVVRGADVLLCATSSATPIFDPAWLQPGVHINSVGPKFRQAHELDLLTADAAALIVTDSVAQAQALPRPFFLQGTRHMDRLVELSHVVSGDHAGRVDDAAITLFCSVGLAATEVVVAAAALRKRQGF